MTHWHHSSTYKQYHIQNVLKRKCMVGDKTKCHRIPQKQRYHEISLMQPIMLSAFMIIMTVSCQSNITVHCGAFQRFGKVTMTIFISMQNADFIPQRWGSRQNLKNWMDVRREFYLQKRIILATMFEYTRHQFHENLNWKFGVTEGSQTDSGSKWNRKGK